MKTRSQEPGESTDADAVSIRRHIDIESYVNKVTCHPFHHRLRISCLAHRHLWRFSSPVSQIVRSDVMSFMYNSLIDASDIGYTVRWISFSKLGEYFAVGTSRSITVWSVESGAPLAEDLSTQSIDPLCITWVSRLSFVVGTQHGCLYSFEIMVKDKVRLTGQYSHSLRL